MEFSSYRGIPDNKNVGNVIFNEFEFNNGTRIGEETIFSNNPAELGIVTGLLTTACICRFRFTLIQKDFFNHQPILLDLVKFKVMLQFFFNLVCFCIFSPFILSSLVFFYVYKCVITLALKIQLKNKFNGLLDGTDVVWAIEEDSCKSVINVFATLETVANSSNIDFLLKLRELAQRKLVAPGDSRLEKLLCLRKKKYGYFYWEKRETIDITEHVRWLDTIDDSFDKEESNDAFFNKIMSKLCAQPLPQNHQSNWEILVSKSHLWNDCHRLKDMEEGLILSSGTNISQKNIGIPIIFRVHHTLGDGFALFKLLLATIADSSTDEVLKIQKTQAGIIPITGLRDKTEKGVNLTKVKPSVSEAELILRKNKHFLGASMPFSLIINANFKETLEKYMVMKLKKFVSFHDFSETVFKFGISKIKKAINHLANNSLLKINRMAKLMSIFIGMPSSFIQQAIRSMDNSALHGPKLSGEKITSFWIESNIVKNIGDRNLLTTIQQVKNATGSRFCDVILAALSASLHKYFKQIGESAPRSLTVVLPSRISIPDDSLRLNNEFTVGLLPLSISKNLEIHSQYTDEINRDPTIMERLFDVARSSHNLRGQSDCLVNFWVMKWLSAILPEVLLRPVLKSNSTLIFSNVPGPQEIQILGQKLRNIVFWVPHRSTTGIGFSLLTYGGNVHLGMIVDKALIQNDHLLAGILENTVQEIHNLHETIFMSHFSKSWQNFATASTKTESECCEFQEE